MHFIGTICFSMGISYNGVTTMLPTTFDPVLTVFSAVIPFVLCFVGFFIATIHLFFPLRKLKIFAFLQQPSKFDLKQELVSPIAGDVSPTSPSNIEVDLEVGNARQRLQRKLTPKRSTLLSLIYGDEYKPHILQIIIGSLFAATGVCAMHYSGMHGARTQYLHMTFNGGVVFASVVIAAFASFAALWIAFHVEREYLQVVSALIAGIAVCGMHYTGMAAASYQYMPEMNTSTNGTLSSYDLILIVTLATTLTCFVMLVISSIARKNRFVEEKKIDMMNQETKRVQMDKLDKLVNKIVVEEYQTRKVMDLVTDPVCVIDEEGRIMKANSSFDQLCSITPDTVRGSLNTFVKDLDLKGLMADNQRVIVFRGTISNKISGSIAVTITSCAETTLSTKFCVLVFRKRISRKQVQQKQLELNLPVEGILEDRLDGKNCSPDTPDVIEPRPNSWYNSQVYELKVLLENPDFVEGFKEFTRKEWSEENLEFVLMVKEYRKCSVTISRTELQDIILNRFVKIGAEKQLNLPKNQLEIEYHDIVNSYSQVDVFDRLEKKVLEILLDTFIRYKQVLSHSTTDDSSTTVTSKD
jgi:NO-binding membrane sensor protein with MHYT domain